MKEIKIRFNDAHYKMLLGIAGADEAEVEELIEQSIIKMLKKSVKDYDKVYSEFRQKKSGKTLYDKGVRKEHTDPGAGPK